MKDIIQQVYDVKDAGNIPRVHGNGFIQLDLVRGRQRLHIWGPHIPFKQSVYSGIHNHIFDFSSVCLGGELVHTRVDVSLDEDNFTHYTYQAVQTDTDDTVLEQVGTACLMSSTTEYIGPTDTYSFKAGDFHETDSIIPTATVMTTTANYRDIMDDPLVLCDKEFFPSNDFTRYQDPDILWDIIFETLNSF